MESSSLPFVPGYKANSNVNKPSPTCQSFIDKENLTLGLSACVYNIYIYRCIMSTVHVMCSDTDPESSKRVKIVSFSYSLVVSTAFISDY